MDGENFNVANNRFVTLCAGSYWENITGNTAFFIGWYFKPDKILNSLSFQLRDAK